MKQTAIERLVASLTSENGAFKLRRFLSAQPVTLTDARLAADCIDYVRQEEVLSNGASPEELRDLHLHLLALAARIEEASVDA